MLSLKTQKYGRVFYGKIQTAVLLQRTFSRFLHTSNLYTKLMQ